MITIGQLAGFAGVTVRAVRHYHERGLLAEPPRDASGYRRYGHEHLVELIKIATLADAGVPLARIGELLASGPEQVADAIAEIDRNLRERIAELERTRRAVAALAAGDRLVVPPDVADYLERLRSLGVSERYVEVERDGWVLVRAAVPEHVSSWIAAKRSALDDEEFRRLCIDYDRCADWPPDDPRLEQLADRLVQWSATGVGEPGDGVELDPALLGLIERSMVDASSARQRLHQLVQERQQATSTPTPL